ncbi:hypothetical protein KSS87_022527 [Heliosperma pusillum]|nr:hypothetical protein KSS87_022527 [Heliosperma pusillum]
MMVPQNHMNSCKTHGFVTLLSSAHCNFPSTRVCLDRRIGRDMKGRDEKSIVWKVVDAIQVIKGDSRNANVKKANLAAKKRERVKLPHYANAPDSKTCHISEFFKHPMGIEAMLNVNALEYYIPLDANTYRCRLPPIQLLNFEVAPVLDLQVNSTTEDCTVELLSCKAKCNGAYRASMKNLIRWSDDGKESFLDVDVRLLISLEASTLWARLNMGIIGIMKKNDDVKGLYTSGEEVMGELRLPYDDNALAYGEVDYDIFVNSFNGKQWERKGILGERASPPSGGCRQESRRKAPVSGGCGDDTRCGGACHWVVQALLDRFVPVLSQQLLRDYDVWIKQQSNTLPYP